MDRLFNSAKAIDLIPPVTRDEMSNIIKKTIKHNNIKDAYILPIISRGIEPMGLIQKHVELHQ